MTNPVPGRSTYLWIAGVIVALDQVTKALVHDFMTLHESRTIVEGVVRLTYVQNRGAAPRRPSCIAWPATSRA